MNEGNASEDDDGFDEFWRNISGLPDAEKQEMVLGFLLGGIESKSVEEVREMRDYLFKRFKPSPALDLMLECMDGHLAFGK